MSESTGSQMAASWLIRLRRGWYLLSRRPPLRGFIPRSRVSVTWPDGRRETLDTRDRVAVRGKAEYYAFVLPDELVLGRDVMLPWLGSKDLEQMLRLEVLLNSPFTEEETAWGWADLGEKDGLRHIRLAIASRTDVANYLVERLAAGNKESEAEVWASLGERFVPIFGYAERRRLASETRQWLWGMGQLGLFVILLLALITTPALLKRAEIRALEAETGQWRAQTAPLIENRSEIDLRLDQLDQVEALRRESVEIESVLEILTALIPDDGWLDRLEMRGRLVVISGAVANAAALQQTLQRRPEFTNVRAAAALSRDAALQRDRFSFEMEYRP